MSTLRLTSDLRREQILEAARRCFARYGYAGSTTKRLAQAAAISEGLLFKHFPTKAALYAELLAEECEADPDFHRLLELEPSTATLVILIRDMVAHFRRVTEEQDEEEAQRFRLLMSSLLGDGEFARIIYAKIGAMIGPVFEASMARAAEGGDLMETEGEPLDLFWFAHQAVLVIAMSRLPATPVLAFADKPALERQICEFILRGIGLTPKVIASHIDSATVPAKRASRIAESA